MQIRKCKKCKIEKSLTDFSINKICKDSREYECRRCASTRKNKWELKNPEKHSNSYYKARFGLSLEEYDKMFKSQSGTCAICKQPETELIKGQKIKKLAVDHCHRTNKIRALLCGRCNKGLGCFKDNPALFDTAAKYLLRYSN